ncbi:dihydrodipicolinate synthase family protein [uncultured Oscillibacter sp.]|uniref:dihydrodipicolinate synthase family protein n=1 Tax=uncultured Oscillibacter sp. TaxID=876091 RepID=UPI0025DA014F|nr:dihydrodipicolinate synthase family protein [uncultured Oscillibacter sp.]
MEKKLMGVFAPISTPFTADGHVDYGGLAKNAKYYAAAGLKGYLALGSNGENKSLSNKEKLRVLEAVVQNKGEGQTVMAGCIFESTMETIEMGKEMCKRGTDFLTLLPPCYFKNQMTDDVLLRYFSDVADVMSVPCLVYNAPQYAGGVGLSPKLIRHCADHPNIVGVKDSSTGNMEGILFAVRDKPDFTVMAGSVNNFFTAMTMGGAGGVLSLSNSFPEVTVELYNLLVEKRYPAAIALNARLLEINRAIGGAGGVAAVKAAMDMNGLVGGDPRLPLPPLTAEQKEALKAKLKGFGLLN